jgi:sigma-B regulation protein RsbU (phosphoserine phosphatase)
LTGTVLVIAIIVVIISRRDITRTVFERESHAVANTAELVALNIATRWSALLDDKIRMVRNERAGLMEIGTLLMSSLESFTEDEETGESSREEAQAEALDWLDGLRLDDEQREIFIYDENDVIVASMDPAQIGQDLSWAKDFNDQPLTTSMREEARMFGHGFTIYEYETASGQQESRFVHVRYLRPWNWALVVSDSSKSVIAQIEARKTELEMEVLQTLSTLVLAQNGFVVILADDGRLVVPPPPGRAELLEEGGAEFLKALSLARQAAPDDAVSIGFPFRYGGENWQAEYGRFRPLGWTMAALVPEEDLTLPARRLVSRLTAVSAAVFGLSLMGALFFAARLVRPLDRLTRFARALPEQDFLSPEGGPPAEIAALAAYSRDEIGLLASAFQFMDRRLRENILRLIQETSGRERLESELDIARSIQLGLLPLPMPEETRPFVDVRTRMVPAREVGGDLYDFFLLSDKELCLAIGDVSGKGVPAALFMAITRTLIRSAARDEKEPGRMVETINNRLSENNPNLMFVTLFLALLNIESGELRFVNAGHPPSLVVSKEGRTRRLEGLSGPACGIMEDRGYKTFQDRLEPGDLLIGYTDGVTEAVNLADEQYGEERLEKVLSRPDQSAEETASAILADVETFTSGAEPFDDVTLIVVKLS